MASRIDPLRLRARWLAVAFMTASMLLSAGTGAGAAGNRLGDLAPPTITLSSLPEQASADSVVENDQPQLHARLLIGDAAGQKRIGVLFDLEPGWHVYWRNPGGTGLAPRLTLSAPGYDVGEVVWPSPQTFAEADGLFTTWGYEHRVLLSAPMVAQTAEDGSAAESFVDASVARVDARVLVCRTQCVPAELSMQLPLAADLSSADQARIDTLFEEALARAPIPARLAGVQVAARWDGATPPIDGTAPIELAVETCATARPDCPALDRQSGGALFVPMEGDTFEFEPAKAAGDAGGRILLTIDAMRLEAGVDRLRGLVPIRDASGRTHHIEIDTPIGAGGAMEAAFASTAGPSSAGAGSAIGGASLTGAGSAIGGASLSRWLQILGLALLGGLILNGMPCVLPVLAIKVVSVADMAEKDSREVRLHGIAYTVGVLGSMGVLAGIVIALRAAGRSVGWGFQFQEPIFVAAITAVLVAFALNLFGVFEIDLGQGRLASIGQDKSGASRSLFEGLLAVVLATPCTAPFLGTAVGFAFASSGLGIAAIFATIGLGLASPFLVVSFFPHAARFIPRSGPWMITLRQGLGFSLLATVIWLLWVLGQSGGADAIVATTTVLLALSFLLWGLGKLQPMRSAWLGRAFALTVAGFAAAGFNLIELDRIASEAVDARQGEARADAMHEDGWTPYSETALQATLAAGRSAFVVFTADWCITCKVNERTVLDREAVLTALDTNDFVRFKADWTRRDETIRRKLAEFGRAGVPLYLLYTPEDPESPQVLSELLSVSEVVSAVENQSRRRI